MGGIDRRATKGTRRAKPVQRSISRTRQGKGVAMIYNDAWRGVCALYDAVYGPYDQSESEETLDNDGELCDDEEEEEAEWNA